MVRYERGADVGSLDNMTRIEVYQSTGSWSVYCASPTFTKGLP